jgi:hypothetical protein
MCFGDVYAAGQSDLELPRESVHKPHAAAPIRAASPAGSSWAGTGSGSREQSHVTSQLMLSKFLQFLVGGGAGMEVTMEELEYKFHY